MGTCVSDFSVLRARAKSEQHALFPDTASPRYVSRSITITLSFCINTRANDQIVFQSQRPSYIAQDERDSM